jgi:hypothetical protein
MDNGAFTVFKNGLSTSRRQPASGELHKCGRDMSFWKNREGNIAVMTALLLPVLVGGAGLGIETGYWYYEELRLQQAADAAAYAAALEQRAGSTEDAAQSEAERMAAANGFDADNGALSLASSFSDEDKVHRVEARLTQSIPRLFSAAFSDKPITLKVKATAAYATAKNACILALDKSASPGITFSGNAKAEMDGCVIMSDSLASQSILFDGNSNVSAPCIIAVGGYVKKGNASFAVSQCKSVQTGQPPAGDPYSTISYPFCYTYLTSGVLPGCYNSLTVNANSTVNFSSGTYVIDGGTFRINANAKVTGSGVTFVLLNGATVDFNGNATIQLSAPTSGDYKGMLFMGSRTSTLGGMSSFNGNASSYLTGVLYFPRQDISYSGNFSGNNGCTQIVANTISWTGNTRFSVDCSAEGLEPVQVGASVYLVQ